MNKTDISKVKELLKFLPKFNKSDKFIKSIAGGNKNEEGVIIMPMPIYTDDVQSFFSLLDDKFWIDYEYPSNVSEENLYDDSFIKNASFEQIKSLLTFINRSERFCNGCWYGYLRNGRITLILNRLKTLANDN